MAGLQWCTVCQKSTHWTRECWGLGTVAMTAAYPVTYHHWPPASDRPPFPPNKVIQPYCAESASWS